MRTEGEALGERCCWAETTFGVESRFGQLVAAHSGVIDGDQIRPD